MIVDQHVEHEADSLQHLWQEKPLLLGMPDISQGYLHINSHWCYHSKRHTQNKKKKKNQISPTSLW